MVCRNTGPDDVQVKILYCGLCHSDIHQVKNDLGMSNYPMVPGYFSFTFLFPLLFPVSTLVICEFAHICISCFGVLLDIRYSYYDQTKFEFVPENFILGDFIYQT